MTHYCPVCGEYSWHPPTTKAWAVTCPHCGHKGRQHPHRDTPRERRPLLISLAELAEILERGQELASASTDEHAEGDTRLPWKAGSTPAGMDTTGWSAAAQAAHRPTEVGE